jgi:hypothetical protein
VLPFWLERQSDVSGPDFIPGSVAGSVAGSSAVPPNVTHRTWSLVGTVATPDRGVVDPRGLVTPTSPGDGGGWSLDWWIGGDDRWHAPAREAAVRQRLVGEAPVVETLMRIPGGDAVQRAYAIHASTDSPFGQAFLIVEIENASAVPFALVLSVRPYNPTGYVPVHTISLEGPPKGPIDGRDEGSDHRLMVNGELGVVFPKAPARAAATTAAEGDVDEVVFAGHATETFTIVRCPEGQAQAAVVFPLPHTAILRVALPLGRPVRPRRRPVAGAGMRFPAAVPSAEQVAKGWETQARRGVRLSLPDPIWETAVETGRRWLLVAHGGEDLAAWPSRPLDWVEAESVLAALGEQGFHDEAAQVLATLPERQGLDGSLVHPGGTAGANGAALVALARHVALSADVELAESLVGPVAKAVHWIDKRRRARRRGPSLSTDDVMWSVRGLEAAATMLDGIAQPEVATDARAFADTLSRERPSESIAAEVSGVAVVDPGGRAGLSPFHTLGLARAELAAGDPVSLERFAWVLSVASATGTWPEVVHPRTGGGSAGDGHHGATGAEVLRFVRELLVRETDSGLALCRVLPPDWLGQGFEVHDAPTAFGRLSYAVRWHGARPALLWDLDVHPGTGPVVLTAPGLDPTWQASESKGEALLAAPAGTEAQTIGEPPPEPGVSFS